GPCAELVRWQRQPIWQLGRLVVETIGQRDDGEAPFMTDWPDDWFRDAPRTGAKLPGNASDPAPATPGAAGAERAAAEPTVQLPHRSAPSRSAGPGGPTGAGGPGRSGPGWPEQPAAHAPRTLERSPALGQFGGAGGSYPGWSVRPGWRRWLRPRPIM